MNQTEKKKSRAWEIKELMAPLAIEYMDEETYGCALKLLSKLTRKRTVDITKGKKEIWAGAIIYVIARLNFMFDKKQDYWMTADEIAGFFSISKSTVSQKATLIEKLCSIGMLDEEFRREKIAKGFSFQILASGFIVPTNNGDVEDYKFSEIIPEEVASHSLFEDAARNGQLKVPRKVTWEAEKKDRALSKQIAQDKINEEKRLTREENARLAVEEAERKQIELDRVQPRLFD